MKFTMFYFSEERLLFSFRKVLIQLYGHFVVCSLWDYWTALLYTIYSVIMRDVLYQFDIYVQYIGNTSQYWQLGAECSILWNETGSPIFVMNFLDLENHDNFLC